jgi:zinc protease
MKTLFYKITDTFENSTIKVCLLSFILCSFFGSCSSSNNIKPLKKNDRVGAPSVQTQYLNYQPPEPNVWHLSNGLTVMHLFDDEFPIVRMNLFVKGGSLWESDAEFGSAQFMGDLLSKSGAGDLSADQLDDKLESLAANISSSIDDYYGSISARCLDSQVEEVFSLFSEVVFRPRFEQSRITLSKNQVLDSLKRRNDSAGSIAGIAFKQLLFGSSALGRVLTADTINRVNKGSLDKSYLRFIRPQDAILAFSGNISSESIEELLNKEFIHWKPAEQKLETPNLAVLEPKAGIFFIEAPFSQATVMLGQQGIPLYTSDHFVIKLFNEVLSGGSMASRLFKSVRAEKGLAYDVGGQIQPSYIKGKNFLYLQTKSESTGLATVSAIEVLQDFLKKEISVNELQSNKDALINSYVFSRESSNEILSRGAFLKLLDYPPDYDKRYIEEIKGVTSSDIKSMSRIRWNPDGLIILVVGERKALDSLLAKRLLLPSALQNVEVQKLKFDQTIVW